MNNNSTLAAVAEFHTSFQHPILTEPQIPTTARCVLRVALLQEELKELVAAIDAKDIVEAADAFVDLQYVLSGAILEFGLKDKFPALFAEVHRSNMSKACQTMDEAIQTADDYLLQHGDRCHVVPRNGLFFVYRTSDMKTIKSVNYSPANLAHILNTDVKPD